MNPNEDQDERASDERSAMLVTHGADALERSRAELEIARYLAGEDPRHGGFDADGDSRR